MTDGRHIRWIVAGSIALYLGWAALLIAQRPGLQYDESLMVVDSVHMLHSRAELDLPHDPYTWVCPLGRCIPLMTSMYIGPVKAYLSLPFFAIFGVNVEIIRLISVFLAALLILGVATLTGELAGTAAAAAAALAIAMNPAFVDCTVFDNNGVAPMMAATGLLCWSIARYLRRRDFSSAVWIGASVGFGIWARANHVFLLAAAGVAVVLLMRRKLLLTIPASHWIGAAAGAFVLSAPLLIFELRSGGATWHGLDTFSAHQSLSERLYSRVVGLAEGLLSDREHRAMWDGPDMPTWQRWFSLPLMLSACVVVFVKRGAEERATQFARIMATALVTLTLIFFGVRVQISEHHLIADLPLAAMVVGCAGVILARSRIGAGVAGCVAIVYLGSAIHWQIAAAEGLGRTGGVGMWSDGIFQLTEGLARNSAGRPAVTPDWGLSYNVYVLSGASVRMAERHDVPEESADGMAEFSRRLTYSVAAGRIFVLNAPEHRFFPEASRVVLDAIRESPVPYRKFSIRQRDGREFAQIYQPGAPTAAAREPGRLATFVSAAEAGDAPQLMGVYEIEDGRWRWTRPQFSITLGRPDSLWGNTAQLAVQFYVPDIVIQRLGSVSLSVQLREHMLAPETISRPGDFTFARSIPAEWLVDANTFQFSLNKAWRPSAPDLRELGLIVKTAALGE